MIYIKNLILGAGPAGLGASYRLFTRGEKSLILEKNDTYGGLCGNFTINGFRFDKFVHFSFAKDDDVNRLFAEGAGEVYKHVPIAYNFYKGIWIKHPAQNNLYPLSEDEKKKVVDDFIARPKDVKIESIENYDQWLRLQFGNYFAENFPIPYTRKYWMSEAKDLETKWMGSREGSRLYQPSVQEVIEGCKTSDTPVTYYSKEMRYPRKGGYKAYFNAIKKNADIAYNNQVEFIDAKNKIVKTSVENYEYERLISSLPLPEVVKMLVDAPEDVKRASRNLRCTSGYMVSIALKNNNIPPYLWWYIYDEEILPARVYSPSLKSPDNVPPGCSSLQLEIYCEEGKYSNEELLENSVEKLCKLGVINKEDILFTDIRFEKYANVIFDHQVYESREIVRSYLKSIGIETIGRFGEWDYLWSDQSLLSGLRIK